MELKSIATIGLRSVTVGLASLQVKPNLILDRANIKREIIDDPDGRITPEQLNLFWDVASTFFEDPLIALNMSKYIPFGTYQVTDHLLSSASNLNEGLIRFYNYYSIVNQDIELISKEKDDKYIISLKPLYKGQLNAFVMDFEVGLICSRLKTVTKNKIDFSYINIAHGKKEYIELYEKSLDTNIQFETSETQIVFDKKYLKLACSESNSNLFDLIEKNAKTQFSKLKTSQLKENEFLTTLYCYIRTNLKDGDFSIEGLSSSLNISVRTLQRKLKDLGLTYKEALVETRKTLSFQLLEDLNLSIAEIAYLTGFSEASAFHRAFKQWTGQTPLSYRRELS